MSLNEFQRSAAKMEDALANVLNAVSGRVSPGQLERILKLIIKKEIILEFLLEEIPTKTNL